MIETVLHFAGLTTLIITNKVKTVIQICLFPDWKFSVRGLMANYITYGNLHAL